MDNRKRTRQQSLTNSEITTSARNHVRNVKRRRRRKVSADCQTTSDKKEMVGKVEGDNRMTKKACMMETDHVALSVKPVALDSSSSSGAMSATEKNDSALDMATENMTKGTSLEEKRLTHIVTPRPSLVGEITQQVQKELDVNGSLILVAQSSSIRTIETSGTMSSNSSVSSLEMPYSKIQTALSIASLYSETPKEIHVKQDVSDKTYSAVAEDTNDEPSLRRKARSTPLSLLTIGFLTLVLCLAVYTQWSHSHLWKDIDPHAIFVPGAGFSGFWFTLGRLQSIQDPASRTYYCYSAGCLGVVASLSNMTVEEVTDMAFGVQDRWNSGTVHRHGVVDDFVDQLLHSDNAIRPMESEHLLSRLNVITTVPNGWFGVRPCVRTPANIDQLREMLLQTTWIPFAVGHSMWHKDSKTGEQHIDGAFSMLSHPLLSNHLHLPISWDLIANILNVNLARSTVKKLWNDGIGHGI